ncbi:MAG: potassium-transporting ATPase subunit KdpC [Bacteroidetes bacterium]|nr:potassium-transporting ATPase subunit KdpC [Bacteroidota bacterium]
MKKLFVSIKLLLAMTLVTGIIYPFIIFAAGRLMFPYKTSGSLIERGGKIIGSELIEQNFDSTIYFHPRPSAVNCNPLPSGGSNLGPTSKQLKNISDSLEAVYVLQNGLDKNIHAPSDALFSSGSGLDPHISLENARLQSERISNARKFDEDKRKRLNELINSMLEKPQFGILGEPVINVLELNVELDKL